MMRFVLGTCSFPTGELVDFIAIHDRIGSYQALEQIPVSPQLKTWDQALIPRLPSIIDIN